MAMSSYDKSATETQQTLRQTDPIIQALYGNIASTTRESGAVAAARDTEVELAKAGAIDKVNEFASQIGFDSLASVTNDYLKTSQAARESRAQAAAQLENLNKQASVGFMENPFGWLSNQITFEDNYKAAQVAVAASNARLEEASTLKDQMLTMNQAIQEKGQSELTLMKTATASTAQAAAKLAKNAAEVKATEAEIAALQSGLDFKIKSTAITRDVEEMAMARERLALSRAEHAKRMQEEKSESAFVAKIWQSAKLGLVKTRGVSEKEAAALLGDPPKNINELKYIQSSNEKVAAAIRVGTNHLVGDFQPMGSSLEEVGTTLTELQATGTGPGKTTTQFVKTTFAQAAATEQNPKLKAQKGALAVETALKNKAMLPIQQGEAETNPLFLESPAAALLHVGEGSDPRMQKLKAKLLAQPMIQALAANKMLESTDPDAVGRAAVAWARQNGVSPNDTAATLAALYKVPLGLKREVLLQHAIDPNIADSGKYPSKAGAMWGTKNYRPHNEKDMLKFVISAGVEEAQKQGPRTSTVTKESWDTNLHQTPGSLGASFVAR